MANGVQPAQFVPPQQIARGEQRAVARVMDKIRYNQPWSFYSTLLIDDFAQVTSQVLSFWQATKGTSGPLGTLAMTNLAQPGQIPDAFRAYGIAIRIAISLYDDPRYFELLANFAAIEMRVGNDEMMVGPVTSFPAGGGVTGTIELPGPVQFIPERSGGGGGGSGDPTQQTAQQAPKKGTPIEQTTGPGGGGMGGAGGAGGGPSGAPGVPMSVLTNGIAQRSNIYSFANDPIKIKKGSNITTDLHLTQAALRELQRLSAIRKPTAPGLLIQLRLEGRRARPGAYGTGG